MRCRKSALAVLGRPDWWKETIAASHKVDSVAIKSQAGARPFSDLLVDLDRLQQVLEVALTKATDERLGWREIRAFGHWVAVPDVASLQDMLSGLTER